MKFLTPSDLRTKKNAWLQARKIAGSSKNMAESLCKTPQSTLNTRINNPESMMPLEHSILTCHRTGVPLESLSPDTSEANELVRTGLRNTAVEISIKAVRINPALKLRSLVYEAERPIILDQNQFLISGAFQKEMAESKGLQKISAMVLDLNALYSKDDFLRHINARFLPTEKAEIGLALKEFLKTDSAQRSALKVDPAPQNHERSCPKRDKGSPENHEGGCPEWDKKRLRNDEKIAQALELRSKSNYNRLEQTYFKAVPELLQALNKKHVSIYKAAEVAKGSESEQHEWIHSHLRSIV